jgi:hypothetical protein
VQPSGYPGGACILDWLVAITIARPNPGLWSAHRNVGSDQQWIMRKELLVAGVQRPSFLKRQKEQQRAAKAAQKRETKRLKQLAKAEGNAPAEEEFQLLDGPPNPEDME